MGSFISAAVLIAKLPAKIIGINRVLRNTDTVVDTPQMAIIAGFTLASLPFKGYAACIFPRC